jgi:hypothetical protein
MSAFFIVEADGYYKHWPTFELALADFTRLLSEGESEDIVLRFCS